MTPPCWTSRGWCRPSSTTGATACAARVTRCGASPSARGRVPRSRCTWRRAPTGCAQALARPPDDHYQREILARVPCSRPSPCWPKVRAPSTNLILIAAILAKFTVSAYAAIPSRNCCYWYANGSLSRSLRVEIGRQNKEGRREAHLPPALLPQPRSPSASARARRPSAPPPPRPRCAAL